MLDADEHRLLVGRRHHASELTLIGTDEGAADLSGCRIGLGGLGGQRSRCGRADLRVALELVDRLAPPIFGSRSAEMEGDV